MNFRWFFQSAISASITVGSVVAQGGSAAAEPTLAVYLECTNGTETRQGSGVLVGPNGHVLTARHLAPDGYRCKGAVGNNTKALDGLIVDSRDGKLPKGYDARLLRFVGTPGETFDFAHYCPVSAHLSGARVHALGWHPKKQGYPSQTAGILSSYIADHRGIVESDAITSSGKSGGPVFLAGTRDIVGIIIGSKFDPSTGVPIYFGVLDAAIPAEEFSVMSTSDQCPGSEGLSAPATVDNNALAWKEFDEARYFFDRQDYRRAISTLDNAIRLDNTVPAFFNLRAICHANLQEHGLAIADYDDAIRLEPGNAVFHANRAETHFDINEFGRALRDIDQAIRIDAQVPGAFWVRGNINYRIGNHEHALDDYKSALRLDANNDRIAAKIGVVYSELNQWDNAATYFSEAIHLNPGQIWHYYDRGNAYRQMHDFIGAARDFETMLRLDPNNIDARESLDNLCRQGQHC